MLSEAPSISVIVPTLNEAENIEGIVSRILAGGAALEMEIIVVDDGSRDETQAIVRRLAETLPVTLLARDRPKDGLAGAVLAGARAARAEAVLVIDADGSHPPEKIPDLAGPVIRGERDMVIGSRYAPGGSTPGWSRKRRLMSRAASACAWPLTDVHDALSGFFAVRRDLMGAIPPDAAGFKIALEILVRGGDALLVAEVPIAFRDRELGQSKMGGRVILTYFRRLLALSGWRESQDSARMAIAKTASIWCVDFAAFAIALRLAATLSAANLTGFAAGAILNAGLKLAQLPPGKRSSPSLLSRLCFGSMLALFLRSGVLWTFASAAHWPALVAIVPAIVTGWVVLFLGYALFIWPVREQYGAGMRWRIAAIGVTAYLIALRIVYLAAIPPDRRILAMYHSPGGLSIGSKIALGVFTLGARSPDREIIGTNLSALLCWAVGAWAVFKGTKRLFDKTTSFRALLLFSVLPVFFWTGTMLSPATVLITAWAMVLYLMTLTLRWEWRLAGIACAAAAGLFWWPGKWLPGMMAPSGFSASEKGWLFLPMQALMVTPAALFGLWRCLARWTATGRRAAGAWAAVCGLVAAIGTFSAYVAGMLSIFASGAMWLPLLPFIARDMERPGQKPSRIWPPVISACILVYGLYLYSMAYAR
jgi:dolichol-phosphate mannosyltransferase